MRYTYKGVGNYDSHCDLEIAGNVVICTELKSNEGTSVTNWCEHLATAVVHQTGIDPQQLIWLERYEGREGCERVTFGSYDPQHGFRHPTWQPIAAAQAAVLLRAEG